MSSTSGAWVVALKAAMSIEMIENKCDECFAVRSGSNHVAATTTIAILHEEPNTQTIRLLVVLNLSVRESSSYIVRTIQHGARKQSQKA